MCAILKLETCTMCIKEMVTVMDKKYIDIDSVVGNLDKVNIKELRKETGMSRQEFCENFEIPYRTLQSWELGDREMPAYAKRLMAYIIRIKKLQQESLNKVEQRGEKDGEENNEC